MINEILLIADKPDIERDAIAKSWLQNGGEIKRIGKFWKRRIDAEHGIILGLITFRIGLISKFEFQHLGIHFFVSFPKFGKSPN